MFENKLKLNPPKTEFIVFGSRDKYKWLKDSFPVNNCFSPMDVVCNVGILFDSKFSFTNMEILSLNPILLTFEICMIFSTFSHMMSQLW